jgi:hypothetical protein
VRMPCTLVGRYSRGKPLNSSSKLLKRLRVAEFSADVP